jgi:hypothetical protein
MASLKLVLLLSALAFAGASARRPNGRLRANFPSIPAIPLLHFDASAPVVDRNGSTIPPYDTLYEFDQLVDHNNPQLGTFKQRFWHTWEFYEPGVCKIPRDNNDSFTDHFKVDL